MISFGTDGMQMDFILKAIVHFVQENQLESGKKSKVVASE